MKTRTKLIIGVALLLALVIATWISVADVQVSTGLGVETRVLNVTVSYTGKGEVDQDHEIVLYLFDQPRFEGPGVQAIALKRAQENGQVVAFREVTAKTVYLVAVYDITGSFESHMDPPAPGSVLAIYHPRDYPTPTPIELGEADSVDIELRFGDRWKVP